MGRKSLKEDRQQEIISVFYEVAKKDGIEKTSIANIAKEMGVNPSLIIHYFKTKDELTYALIDFILQQYMKIYSRYWDEETPLQQTLIEIITLLFSKKWGQLVDDGLFYSCYALTFRDKKVWEKYRKLTNLLRERLTALIHRCHNEGIVIAANPRLTADLIFALVDGAYFYLSVTDDDQTFDGRIAEYREEAVRVLQFREPVQLLPVSDNS